MERAPPRGVEGEDRAQGDYFMLRAIGCVVVVLAIIGLLVITGVLKMIF